MQLFVPLLKESPLPQRVNRLGSCEVPWHSAFCFVQAEAGRSGPAQGDAQLRAGAEDGAAAHERHQARKCHGHLERRQQDVRVSQRRQAVSIRCRHRQTSEIGNAPEPGGRGGRGGRGQGAPERGRQYAFADSPDKAFRAQFNDKDRNLYLVNQSAKAETRITTTGLRAPD